MMILGHLRTACVPRLATHTQAIRGSWEQEQDTLTWCLESTGLSSLVSSRLFIGMQAVELIMMIVLYRTLATNHFTAVLLQPTIMLLLTDKKATYSDLERESEREDVNNNLPPPSAKREEGGNMNVAREQQHVHG